MTKQELYRDLCKEAGTYTGGDMSADKWYEECSHNITSDQDQIFSDAAAGDILAIAEARRECGLPVLV